MLDKKDWFTGHVNEKVRRILAEGKATASVRRRVAWMNWDKYLKKAIGPIAWISVGVFLSHTFTSPVEVIRHPRHIPVEEYVRIHDSIYIVTTRIDSAYYDNF